MRSTRNSALFELGEDLMNRLADNVGQHVQPPAVRHADHDFVHAVGGGTLGDLIQRRDRRLAAFQRESLLADESRVQELFETLRLRSTGPECACGSAWSSGHWILRRFHPVPKPVLLLRNRDVHVLGRELAE